MFTVCGGLLVLNLMVFIIPISAFFCMIVLLGFGRAKFPFLIVLGWWFLWLWVSSLSLTGLYVPTTATYLLYMILLLSVFGGGFIYVSRRQSSIRNIVRESSVIMARERELRIRKKMHNLTIFTLLIIVPIVGYFLFRAVQMFLTLDTLSLYRQAAFGLLDDRESIVYGSPYIMLLYNLIVTPIVYLVFFIGAGYWLNTGVRKVFIIGSILIFAEAVTMMGRFGFYHVLAIFAFVGIMRLIIYRRSIKSAIRGAMLAIFAVALILVPMVMIGPARSDSAFDFSELYNTFVIEYHTLGFTLFDIESNNSDSYLNQTSSYGRASLGALEYIPVLLLRRFDRSIDSIPGKIGVDMNESRIAGQRSDGQPISANAFVTGMYPLYMDGGVPFIIIAGLLYGFMLAKTSFTLFSQHNNLWNSFLLCTLIYCGLFSIFQPVITSVFWLYILLGFCYLRCRLNIRELYPSKT